MTSPCPGEQTLRDLGAGRLDESQFLAVLEHLQACDECALAWKRLQADIETEQEDPADSGIDCSETVTAATECGPHLEEDETAADLGYLLPPSSDRSIGRIGVYEVLQVLGRGGMGVVFKAFDESLCRMVAIKVMSPGLAASAKSKRRFLREARAAAGVNHPNVVTIHAVDTQQEVPYLVMEFIGGRSLRQRIRHGGRFEPAQLLRIGAEIASGLAAAHQHGVIHRDIKPANIMLEDGLERVKITDFGLALAALDRSVLTSAGHVVGTPAYMSPEQINGAAVDPRSDLFSLGCVLYAMVDGHSPFQGSGALEVLRKVNDHSPRPLHQVDPAVPRPFSDLVAQLLEKDPRDRPLTAAAVAEQLMKLLAVVNQASTANHRRLESAGKPGFSRRRLTAGFALVLAALACSLLGAWKWTQKSVRPPIAVAPSSSSAAITVAQTGPARARSIAGALALARPNATIRVLDDATYREFIRIDDPARWRGVTLEAVRGALLVAPEDNPALFVHDTPAVTVRGFRIKGGRQQHGLIASGTTIGLTIEDLAFEQGSGADCAVVLLSTAARGPAGAAVTLRHCRIENAGLGVSLRGLDQGDAPGGGVLVEGNRFTGSGVHLLIDGPVHDVTVRGNLFLGGTNGINLNFPKPSQAQRLMLANNTFLDANYWLGLVFTDAGQEGVVICNNLVLGSRSVESSRPEQPGEAAGHWTFRGNWWETGPDAGVGSIPASRIAELAPSIPLLSRDPKSPDFLRPPPTSPLWTAGAGGELSPQVGAVGPAVASGR